MTPDERDEFAAKAAAVLGDPAYEAGLRREQEEIERQQKRDRNRRLRELAHVAIEALDGKHGEQHQAFARDALTKHGDVRILVAALARWFETRRAAEPSLPLDRSLLKSAVESSAVEYSLRAFEALARQVEVEQHRKKRKAGQNG